MKNIIKLAMIAASATAMTLSAQAHDGEHAKTAKTDGKAACCADSAILSPRAESMRPRMAAASQTETDLVHGRYLLGSAKHPETRPASSGIAVSDDSGRLVSGRSAGRSSTLSPRAQQQLGDRTTQFEIAPVK